MSFCEFCGNEIGYLPFKCKYCGGTFCKKHRLPENHECSFELKHTPVVPLVRRENSFKSTQARRDQRVKQPRRLRRYLKRQDEPISLRPRRSPKWRTSFPATKNILILIITISIIASILINIGLGSYIFFSLYGLYNNFAIYTIFTSLFITNFSIFSFTFIIQMFFLIIMLFFTYLLSRSIEIALGSWFLIKLYLISTIFSALFYILLRLTLIYIYPIESWFLPIGFAWGGILGLISYSLFPVMNQEITALMMIIPMRMKGRSFLIIIILLRLFPLIIEPELFWFYLPDLGGILGSYLLFKYQQRRI
jgi:hypothetical protein